MKKHILFITTANLPTNPRLLKEVDIACKQYKVTVIIWKLGNWSDNLNQQMIEERLNINFHLLDATKGHKFNWLIFAIIEKLARILYPFLKKSLLANAVAQTRRSLQLYRLIKRQNLKPNLVIAHNLGALYPAYQLSLKNNIPFTFDIEDYHPGELIEFDTINEKERRELLMKKMLPKAKVLTSASPLIGEHSLKLLGGHPNHTVILNGFSNKEFSSPKQPFGISDKKLKLVWFSQTISFGRGLEQLFGALMYLAKDSSISDNTLQLTLIGELDKQFEQQHIQPLISNTGCKVIVEILPPLSQKNLHKELANHDIGLALEYNSTDINRQICLTNKIFAYAQAGLYILATDTPAQKMYIEKYSGFGLLCEQSDMALSESIKYLISNAEHIKCKSEERFLNARERLSWEVEEQKLNAIWNNIVDKNR
ncbi:glycosyltransferase family protein [Carboxylicivirga marina]|uniref:Glycosyltransferase subfamily 4-like N-terminal domain-containing protein n=1 Tax=Carboxylicivirga marina TaxID=2800988 RepID=A0ABS1HJ12_9BACT|nr:hypothetical protein [Carboxylicivirga marina]MBK3517673.1 hypothetical protein [Carboxylicivirga marina]